MGNIKIHDTDYISDIKQIIEQSRKHTYASINTIMIKSYWLVGRRIVEEEQGGTSRAEYGKYLLKNLAEELTPIYGNTYSVRRLQDYRQFYLYFKDIEIWHSRMPNLTWTHYRELLTINDEKARHWYMQEEILKKIWDLGIGNWELGIGSWGVGIETSASIVKVHSSEFRVQSSEF